MDVILFYSQLTNNDGSFVSLLYHYCFYFKLPAFTLVGLPTPMWRSQTKLSISHTECELALLQRAWLKNRGRAPPNKFEGPFNEGWIQKQPSWHEFALSFVRTVLNPVRSYLKWNAVVYNLMCKFLKNFVLFFFVRALKASSRS